MALGPVQILVVGFGDAEFKGTIRAELERLREADVVRLIDMIAVRKDHDGTVQRLQQSDMSTDELQEFGAIVGALIGHRWAIPLRDAIRDMGGFHIADAWIHPADLVAIGAATAEEVGIEETA